MSVVVRGLTCGVVILGVAACVMAADAPPPTATKPAPKPRKPPPLMIIEPEAGGIDFKIQGEYAAKEGSVALQLIARRDNAGGSGFHAVIYHGGLPGAGWDGRQKVELDGKLNGDKAELADGKGTTVVADGQTAKVKLPDGPTELSLPRIERHSPTLGAKPPAGATVLFDGTNVDAWKNAKIDKHGSLVLAGGWPHTKQGYTDFTAHLEFMLSYMPASLGQDRGNSGVYMQGRYEIQVLDSFGLEGKDNECGGVYKVAAPKVNMCFPPLTWQTYDIDFTAAKWENAKKVKPAILTVKHNGVTILENVEIKGNTGSAQVKDDAAPGPLYLQDHGDPVFYRNIWIVEKKGG